MNSTATQYFSIYRIHSVTRPELSVGLLQGFSDVTRQQLESLTAEDLEFYIDEYLMRSRGDERHTEQFVLQASNSLDGPWEDIMPIVPLSGDPDDVSKDDDDDRWGKCLRCQRNLTESEAALNDVCEGCRPEFIEDWQNNQDRLAEEADERRRYPEESDDDDAEDEDGYDCYRCGNQGCARCEPNWCTNCNNNGCAKCDPANVCQSCKQYVSYGWIDEDSGLCQSCVSGRKPKCSECHHYLPDGEDGLCTPCRVYLAIARCFYCRQPHEDFTKSNDDICQDCEDFWNHQYPQLTPWWRRALRACKFWR